MSHKNHPTTMRRRIITLILTSAIVAPMVWAYSPPTKVQVSVLRKSSTSWDGAPLPSYPEGTPEITILRITIPPHTSLPMHHHPVINAGVLTKGTLTVTTPNGRTLLLNAGDALIELVNQPHFGRNEGDEPAEIIVFYAGVVDKPITVSEAEGPPKDL